MSKFLEEDAAGKSKPHPTPRSQPCSTPKSGLPVIAAENLQRVAILAGAG